MSTAVFAILLVVWMEVDIEDAWIVVLLTFITNIVATLAAVWLLGEIRGVAAMYRPGGPRHVSARHSVVAFYVACKHLGFGPCDTQPDSVDAIQVEAGG
jgi:hypothetical protein